MKKKIILFITLVANATLIQAQCPEITCPTDITQSTDAGLCEGVVNYTTPVGTDPCDMSSQTFNFTGAAETFTVPAGVTSLDVDVIGASGSIGGNPYGFAPGQGGDGARVQTTITVTPGEVLNIYVGGEGTLNLGGFNGGGDGGVCDDPQELGGGGGGASDIRQGGATLNDRVVVAGGGGGGGASAQNDAGGSQLGGDGGDAGELGLDGIAAACNSTPGLGGTATAGGNAGINGFNGALGLGGVGADCGAVNYYGDGGGGGGGYYGGGGGGSDNNDCAGGDDPGGAGGGGGSSYSAGTSTTFTSGYNTGDGQIIISWSSSSNLTTTQIAGMSSGSTFPLGTTTNTFEVSDGNGNTDQCSFDITIVDAEAPTLDSASLSDVEVECEINSLDAPTATDLCDGSVTGTSDAVFPIDNDTVVVWTYEDAEGNSITQNQNVVITGLDVSVSISGITLTANKSGATYQWIDCSDSSSVADADGQSFTPTQNGDYAVIITDGNCTDTSACESVTSVGVKENLLESDISIYPNPNSGSFTLDLGKVISEGEVQVLDIQGRVVQSIKIENTQELEMEITQQSGVYMLKVTTEDGQAMIRVVKND